jgi:hypothetical protein
MRTLNQNIKSCIATAMLLCTGFLAQAQTPSGGEDVLGDIDPVTNTTIINAKVGEAYKLNEVPVPLDTVIPIPPIEYDMVAKQMETEYAVDTIKAASLRVMEKLTKLYKGYVRAGIGTQTTPLLEVYYNNLRSRNGSWGVHYRHLSSSGAVKDAGDSQFSENQLGFNGKMFLREHTLKGAVDWDRRVLHYYGYDPIIHELSADSTKQLFNYIGFNTGISSNYKNSTRINHDINLRYYNYSDNYEASENNVLLTAKLNRYVDTELYGVDATIDYNGFKPAALIFPDAGVTTILDPEVTSSTIIRLDPHISTIRKDWRVKVGLGIQTDITHTATFHFYPMADFRYSLFDNIFIPYVGVNGGIERNSFLSMTRENPFMLPNTELKNSFRDYDIYGGIRGSISATTSFNLRVSTSRVKNMALFVNDTTFSIENKFMVQYDTTTMLNLRGEFTYHKSEKLKVHARADYYSYNNESALYAWNLPDFKVSIAGTYNMFDKILIKAEVYALGGRKAQSLYPDADATVEEGINVLELQAVVDANIGLEYRYTKRLSAFLNFNNVAAQKYPRWYNYRTQGLQVLGGATYSF